MFLIGFRIILISTWMAMTYRYWRPVRMVLIGKNSPNVGLEPTTVGLRVQRSTDWASRAECALKYCYTYNFGSLLGLSYGLQLIAYHSTNVGDISFGHLLLWTIWYVHILNSLWCSNWIFLKIKDFLRSLKTF